MIRQRRFGLRRPALLLATLTACGGVPSGQEPVEGEDSPQPHTTLPDRDGDGIADAVDNCPRIPNAPIAGVQPAVCGAGASDALARFVSLRTRTFLPPAGVHPTLRDEVGVGRRHFMVHVTGNGQDQVLRPAQREQLAHLGVQIVSYAPRRTYFVSAPNNLQTLNEIAALEFVVGLSPVLPDDRVPPSMRRRGPKVTSASGIHSVEVQMFADVTNSDARAMFARKAVSAKPQGEGVFAVEVTATQLAQLAREDTVMWIDDPMGRLVERGIDAQVMIDGFKVSGDVGLDGSGITVAATDLQHVTLNHPSFVGRLTWGNNPVIIGFPDPALVIEHVDHANGVTSILGANDPDTGFKGLLPEASVITFQVGDGALVTPEDVYKGISKDARNDHDATAINYSIGIDDCDKLGEYRLYGKQRDTAIDSSGIVVVASAGNLGNGVDCPAVGPGFSTLDSPMAKNDIVVANVCGDVDDGSDCPTLGGMAISSSAGPTADGRLKPDLSAPGDGNATVRIESDGSTSLGGFGGTSAAAPVVTGVAGWISEAFIDGGATLASIPPERIKAILLHTAKDIERPGPDYRSGYGLVQAPAAVRIAQEWTDWGREGEVTGAVPEVRLPFVINSPQYLYKATLVWTDDPGDINASQILRNDLDLILESPSGATSFSWDLSGNFGQTVDAQPCAVAGCDSVNNVEQVVVRSTNGQPLEYGTWHAVVRQKNLETSSQRFSLVLTPNCPVLIDQDVTLTDGISCTPTTLAPHAVEIIADATLDCADHEIHGLAGLPGSVGVDVQATGAKVQHCEVTDFETGIRLGAPGLAAVSMEAFDNNVWDNSTFGISVFGANSIVRGNQISDMDTGSGFGVRVIADGVRVLQNNFGSGKTGPAPYPIAIEVGDADNVEISSNVFSTNWKYSIDLNGLFAPVTNTIVQGNEIEGVIESGIRVIGDVQSPDILANTILFWGAGFPAIAVQTFGGDRPSNLEIADNELTGRPAGTQSGIALIGADTASTVGNIITGVGIGITETDVTASEIASNRITNTVASGFWTTIGIQSVDSSAQMTGAAISAHIDANTILRATTGITVSGLGAHRVSGNTATVRSLGIKVSAGSTTSPTSVTGNTVTRVSGIVTGISITDIPNVQLTGNTLGANVTFGITVSRSANANVSTNTSTTPRVGLAMTDCANGLVTGNIVNNPSEAGLRFTDDDDVEATSNRVNNNTAIGIHYASGNGGSVQQNIVTSNGAGISLRVGRDLNLPAACGPINVTSLLAINNTLTLGGLAQSPQVLCDVDLASSSIQP
jgi:parallel beta-helix repeat protein